MDKFVDANTMVKIACNDCKGCSACCRGMGQSIVLTPYDCYRLSIGLDKNFEEMLQREIELHVENGVILPNMKMQKGTDSCGLLDEDGRCSQHAFRPGICRLFPLGRNYDNHAFQYFVLEEACPQKQKSKVKISKWLQEPNLKKNEAFITEWHYFIKDMKNVVEWTKEEPEKAKTINMLILQEFYMKPYDMSKDFYDQYEERKQEVDLQLKQIG